jgi:predicted DNA-binding transcriptional regulator YafY
MLDIVTIRYRNHRGEVSLRHISPHEIRFGATVWHPEKQWLLDAWDLGKEARRTFAMRDILEWGVKE